MDTRVIEVTDFKSEVKFNFLGYWGHLEAAMASRDVKLAVLGNIPMYIWVFEVSYFKYNFKFWLLSSLPCIFARSSKGPLPSGSLNLTRLTKKQPMAQVEPSSMRNRWSMSRAVGFFFCQSSEVWRKYYPRRHSDCPPSWRKLLFKQAVATLWQISEIPHAGSTQTANIQTGRNYFTSLRKMGGL